MPETKINGNDELKWYRDNCISDPVMYPYCMSATEVAKHFEGKYEYIPEFKADIKNDPIAQLKNVSFTIYYKPVDVDLLKFALKKHSTKKDQCERDRCVRKAKYVMMVKYFVGNEKKEIMYRELKLCKHHLLKTVDIDKNVLIKQYEERFA